MSANNVLQSFPSKIPKVQLMELCAKLGKRPPEFRDSCPDPCLNRWKTTVVLWDDRKVECEGAFQEKRGAQNAASAQALQLLGEDISNGIPSRKKQKLVNGSHPPTSTPREHHTQADSATSNANSISVELLCAKCTRRLLFSSDVRVLRLTKSQIQLSSVQPYQKYSVFQVSPCTAPKVAFTHQLHCAVNTANCQNGLGYVHPETQEAVFGCDKIIFKIGNEHIRLRKLSAITTHEKLANRIKIEDVVYPEPEKRKLPAIPLKCAPLPMISSSSSMPSPFSVELYDWQSACAIVCGQSNCVLVAPTGSGKTRVAVATARKAIELNPFRRVAFLVPTLVLLYQQAQAFRAAGLNVGIPAEIKERTFGECVEHFHVVVATDGSFLDALYKKQTVLQDFQLLVFDECHHTFKNSNYSRIMQDFVHKMDSSELNGLRILGLTASPGGSQRDDPCRFMLKLCHTMRSKLLVPSLQWKSFSSCEELLVAVPAVVRQIQDCICNAKLEIHQRFCQYFSEALSGLSAQASVDPEEERKPVHPETDEDLEEMERQLGALLLTEKGERGHDSIDDGEDASDEDAAAQDRTRAEEDVKEEEKTSRASSSSSSGEKSLGPYSDPRIITLQRWLRCFNTASTLLEEATLEQSVCCLESILAELDSSVNSGNQPPLVSTHALKSLIATAPKDSMNSNPKFEALLTLLKERLEKNAAIGSMNVDEQVGSSSSKDSRILIFVQTRAGAHSLARWLNEHGVLTVAIYSARGDAERSFVLGQRISPSQLASRLDAFRSGQVKVAVCTSVLEEGYDLPACDGMICLNGHISPTALIQRCGRARAGSGASGVSLSTTSSSSSAEVGGSADPGDGAKEGKCVFILFEGTKEEERYRRACEKRRILHRCTGQVLAAHAAHPNLFELPVEEAYELVQRQQAMDQ